MGRFLPRLIETIGTLRDRDVGFKLLTEGIDTTTATGELMFHLFASLAQFDRRLTVEHTHAGLTAARARGASAAAHPK